MNWGKLSSVINYSIKLDAHSMAARIPIIRSDALNIALSYLNLGSVIAVPTDTVYGLACDATNPSALDKLYAIKCRSESKPVAICLGQISEVKLWARVSHLPKDLLSALLPGPVTLILECINKLDSSISCQGKVGIRIPDHSFINCLAIGLNKPIALTSANLSNTPSALNIFGFEKIWDRIPAIFDGGNLGSDPSASTIVDLSTIGLYQIVREGVACGNTVKILSDFGLKRKYE
ncbi:threonylcarbamoyl-AMP synthase [Cylas formicarius]|uniref:threonylcarbamoyl-AMP synthase n=1 Tax=Cylas formicarius TaxID=197179 RepID=UPI0029588730|nr:threonylcarbamoyl-AMP synthase [Cylas formicarius]